MMATRRNVAGVEMDIEIAPLISESTPPRYRLFQDDKPAFSQARYDYFLAQSRIIPVAGVGQDAVQIPPAWMLGCGVAPSPDRQVTEAMISPTPHSEVHPTELQVLPSMDLT